MSNLNVGGHLSLGRNPRATVAEAHENGFRSMQIFASSPGAWKAPVLRPEEVEDFVRARRKYEVEPLFIHAIYLINLASADALLARRSRSSLIATLEAGRQLGAAGVVTHIGSHAGRGYEAVADQVAEGLREILASSPEGIDLLLENSSGAGGILGAELFELGDLIERAAGHPRLGVAIDTAHLFGFGWDLPLPGEAERLVDTIDREIGLERLGVIHANDSKAALGSRKDRHENIGEGQIGLEGFRQLLAQPELRQVPWVLETPDLERRIEDRARLEALAVEMLPVGAVNGA